MAEIRLDDGNGPKIRQICEIAEREEPLAGRKRTVDAASERCQRRGISWLDRFLHEKRTDRRNDIYESSRDFGRRGTSVDISHDRHVRPHPVTHGCRQLLDMEQIGNGCLVGTDIAPCT